ncbi:hypothetical protein [Aliiglaciecola litoralis]|uniref:Integrase n=1 Tax=Aliiglaciecola litoralis TaxID=582857 RepID=A0ABP3WV07_9ALTE
MAFNDNVEVISPQFDTGRSDAIAAAEAKKLQKQKWWVLLGTFTLVMVGLLIWVWSRAPIFQSQAILHFSYAQQISEEQAAVPQEQITLNSQRLTSYRVLETLSARLDQEESMLFTPEELSKLLSTQEQLESRIINLYATGSQADILQPVLTHWVAVYLESLAQETVETTEQDLDLGQQKLIALEAKILEQRQLVEQYGEDNNIISMERDENRALTKIKAMGASLDEAEAKQAEATATLSSVKQSIENGEIVTHPEDKVRLDTLRSRIGDIESEMVQLARRYTAEYMNLDPDVVNKKRVLEELKARYQTVQLESQQRFLEDLQRTVVASFEKQKQLEVQLDELGREAQNFNQKLEEYGRQTRSLKQLQEQAQALKDQLVETEVQKPFQAKINVLEEPFVPTYPISPHYWRDTAIATGIALLVSLLALLIFSFINRQRQTGPTMTSYNVVPPSSGLTLEQQMAHQALEQQKVAMLEKQQAPLQLAQAEPAKAARLLSNMECEALFKVANRDGKVAMSFIMAGVSPEEMLQIQVGDIDVAAELLLLAGDYPRSVPLSPLCIDHIVAMTANKDPQSDFWAQRLDVEQFDQMMINMAHDAGLAYPEQFSLAALRHTYLTYLVSMGARLNDLEQVAGYVSPGELSLYRQVNRRGEPVNIEDLNTQYPLA